MGISNKDISSFLEAGKRLMESKLYDSAMIEFHKALKLDKASTLMALSELYQDCVSTGDFEGLIAVGSNILLKNPDNVELANVLGNAYRKRNDFTQAQKLYEHCLQYDSKALHPAYNLAATLVHRELYDQQVVSAIKDFESMKGFQLPESEEGEKYLETLHQEIQAKRVHEEEKSNNDEEPPESSSIKNTDLKKEENPSSETEPSHEINPTEMLQFIKSTKGIDSEEGIQALSYLGIYCIQRQYAKTARWIYKLLVKKEPENEDFRCFQTLVRCLNKDFSTAINQLLDLLGKNPYHRYSLINLGQIYDLQNNHLLARKYFLIGEERLSKSQGYYDMKAFEELGKQYNLQADYEQASEVYEVLAEEQKSLSFLGPLGTIYIRLEKYEEGIATFRKIQELNPTHPHPKKALLRIKTILLNKAEGTLNERKFAPAAELFELALDIHPSAAIYERLMTVFTLMKNDEKVALMKENLQYFEKEQQEQELEDHRLNKLQEGNALIKKRLLHKAIQSYEEALRLKPDKQVFTRLVTLYKKTKQLDRVEDLTQRFIRMIEHQQKTLQYMQLEEQNQKAS